VEYANDYLGMLGTPKDEEAVPYLTAEQLQDLYAVVK
jgi:hypothetical protein